MMEFGVHLPTYWPENGRSDISTALIKTAEIAQNLGFTSLWANDGETPQRAIQRAGRLGNGWLPYGIDPNNLRKGAQKLRELSLPFKHLIIAAHLLVQVDEIFQSTEKKPEIQIKGSIDDIISRLQEYEQAGEEHMICDFETENIVALLNQMQMFSTSATPL